MDVAQTQPEPPRKKPKRPIFIRKRQELFVVLKTVKLWPSGSGVLHGIRSLELRGAQIEFVTHCGQWKKLRNSKTSRLARWLRNKWYVKPCPGCRIPAWKLEKYSSTSFT